MKVTISRIWPGFDSKENFSVVRVDGREVGAIRKFKNTRTTKNPWQAFGLIGSDGRQLRSLLGSFFPSEGGKTAAIAAILTVS